MLTQLEVPVTCNLLASATVAASSRFEVPLVVARLHSRICPRTRKHSAAWSQPAAALAAGQEEAGAHLSAEALCSDVRQSQSQSLQGRWLSAGLSAPGPLSPAGSCPFAPSGGGSQSARLVAPVLGNPALPTPRVTDLGEMPL